MAQKRGKALFDFQAQDADQISFDVGAVVVVLDQSADGWWEGYVDGGDGKVGIFPGNLIEVLPQQAPPRPAGVSPGPPARSVQMQPVQPTKPVKPAVVQAPPRELAVDVSSSAAPTAGTAASSPAPVSARSQEKVGLVSGSTRGVARRDVVVFNSETRVGKWASQCSIYSGFSAMGCGTICCYWALGRYILESDTQLDCGILCAAIGLYTVLAGLAFVVFEKNHGLHRSGGHTPTRALCNAAASIPMFWTVATYLPAMFLLVSSALHMISAFMGEEFNPAPVRRRRAAANSSAGGSMKTRLKEGGKLGMYIFLTFYFALNAGLFTYYAFYWFDLNFDRNKRQQLHPLAPIAKGFGITLDLNCAIVLVPVLRTVIRKIYNRSTADQSAVAKCLKGFIAVVPLEHAISFHKLCAALIAVGTVGHTAVHLVGYEYSPENSINTFGLESYFTGGAICLIMLLMYGAAKDNIRRGQFEVFWYSHHLYIFFYVLLFVHGDNFWNPNVWKWVTLPVLLYIVERILRHYKGALPAKLIQVVHIRPNVYCLSFDKSGVFEAGYKEGQYIFLNCPHVSEHQWHPFTLSSAPQEKYVTCHIRAQKEGSWTAQVEDYLYLMGPMDATVLEFKHQGPEGATAGQVYGPDGKPLFRIDGPHSAPTQHVSDYSNVMVVGAGIGVTPLAATLKSIVHHRWRYYLGKTFPDNATFYWVVNYNDVESFRWMVRTIKEACDAVADMRVKNPDAMSTKRFEVHIFVTSAPKPRPRFLQPSVQDDVAFWGKNTKFAREDGGPAISRVSCGFDEMDLYRTIKTSEAPTVQLSGDVTIYMGRPQWEDHFSTLAKEYHRDIRIGVLFCGNQYIARDLQVNCREFSSAHTNRYFRLHKENF